MDLLEWRTWREAHDNRPVPWLKDQQLQLHPPGTDSCPHGAAARLYTLVKYSYNEQYALKCRFCEQCAFEGYFTDTCEQYDKRPLVLCCSCARAHAPFGDSTNAPSGNCDCKADQRAEAACYGCDRTIPWFDPGYPDDDSFDDSSSSSEHWSDYFSLDEWVQFGVSTMREVYELHGVTDDMLEAWGWEVMGGEQAQLEVDREREQQELENEQQGLDNEEEPW